jgi:glycosyltransferase involved in cell wall biosynthesis
MIHIEKELPLISVIIPTYNCAPYLVSAIQSAMDQTYSNVEIVVVNDGSSDNTDEVVQPFLDQIIYVKQENKGLSGARNEGFSASHGQYICFLDADDLLLPDKVQRQLAVFEREPDLGVVISGYITVAEDGCTEINRVEKKWHHDAMEKLLNHEVFPPHAPLIRRSILEKTALFPEDIDTAESQEDWQLWLDMALNGVVFSSCPEPLCKYRRRPGSISSNPLKHSDGARRVVNWLRQHPKIGPYRSQVERLSNIIDMERVGRAWQVGQLDLAEREMAASLQRNPDFWREPVIIMRLFQNSISLEENNRFLETNDITWFEDFIVNTMFPGLVADAALLRQMRAVVFLAVSDNAYGHEQHEMRKRAVREAYHHSRLVCLSRQGFPSFIRGMVGPEIGSFPGRLQRAVAKL